MLFTAFLLVWLLIVVYSDFSRRRVSNRLIFLGFFFVFFDLIEKWPLNIFYLFFTTFFIFLFFYFFYLIGVMGAGDVKFLTMLFMIFPNFNEILFIYLLGTLLSICYSFCFFKKKEQMTFDLYGSGVSKVKNIPYAAFLALATIIFIISN
jgi:Flp pilus assembly protein protease CpaA